MDNNNQQNEKQSMSLNLSPETANGVYSNLALINHSASEFIIDFAAILPGMGNPTVCSRIIMTPENAKSLLFALQQNVMGYEKTFGTITQPQPQTQPEGGRTIAPFGDGTSKGEA